MTPGDRWLRPRRVRGRMWLGLVGLTVACATAPAPMDAPPSLEAQALGAADSFLRCVERDGAECVVPALPYRLWAAVDLLAFVRDAVPTALLASVPGRLPSVLDEQPARRAFITSISQLERPLRAGECSAYTVTRVDPALHEVLASVRRRIESLLLQDTRMAAGIGALLEEVGQRFAECFLVDVRCAHGRPPLGRIAVVVLDGALSVVGVEVEAPFAAFSYRPEAPSVSVPPDPGFVHPWIPAQEREL